jgi:para-nitrobenzyl esterase
LRQDGRGATHSSEIPYVFDTLQARYGSRTTGADEAAAQAALGYWVAFARQGDPNGQGLPHWPRASATNDFLLDFTNGGPVPGADPWKARLDLIEESAGQVR